jgi:hypothetical protein
MSNMNEAVRIYNQSLEAAKSSAALNPSLKAAGNLIAAMLQYPNTRTDATLEAVAAHLRELGLATPR